MNEQMDGAVENGSPVFEVRNLRHSNTLLSFDVQGDPVLGGGELGEIKTKRSGNVTKITIFNTWSLG